MKYTLNLNSDLVDRVVSIVGAKTKTEAIVFALKEVARRERLYSTLRGGVGAEPEALPAIFGEAPRDAPASSEGSAGTQTPN